MSICYTVRCPDPRRHQWQVEVRVETPDPAGQVFRLPVWIPGSYLVREYARHVVAIDARSGDAPVALTKTDKHSWQAAPCDGPLTLHLTVYARDESVRGAYVDDRRAYFNGAAILPWVEGQTAGPLSLDLPQLGEDDWRVATAMQPEDVDERGFGRYIAADYDELIDHPVEVAAFDEVAFDACGTRHRIVVSGGHRADLQRLARDVQAICEWQIRLFGEPAPFSHYTFLTLATRKGYGGLEHRASTSLIVSRDHLPREHGHDAKGYRSLLGLFSHEYFHSWLVKRIKPAEFSPYDLTRENATRQLWLFEGFTSYYDDRALLASGVIPRSDYLELLAETIGRVLSQQGRLRQTLEEASFDAWIKYYRPDENTPNAAVSYYTKGALVALSLDLELRRRSAGRIALDDVMRALWQQHGAVPLADGEFEALAEAVSGVPLSGFFERALRSTEDLPLAEQLAAFGIEWQWVVGEVAGKKPAAHLGAKVESRGAARIRQVDPDGPAQAAGLAVGDEIAAIDGWQVSGDSLAACLAGFAPGQRVQVHAFRDGRLRECRLRLEAPPPDTCRLQVMAGADDAARALRDGWLGGDE